MSFLTGSHGVDSTEDCKLLFCSRVHNESDGILLRARLQVSARRLGFSPAQREDMVLVAAEMASNQVKHAAGKGMLQVWQQPGGALDLVALDFGPGIGNVSLAQEDGYSTVHTLGKGLGSIRRLSDEFEIFSQPKEKDQQGLWHGTAAWARFWMESPRRGGNAAARPAEDRAQIGLFLRPFSDDRFNGDRIYLERHGDKLRWLHLDGLGHGENAQQAFANFTGHLFHKDNLSGELVDIDRCLAGTRGAVAVVTEVDLAGKSLSMLGVGDMSAHVYQDGEMHNFSFAPGILGREHKSAKVTRLACGRGCLIVTNSDGIRHGWDASSFPGLFSQHPQLVAYLLGNVMGRVSDDQSVCAVRINS